MTLFLNFLATRHVNEVHPAHYLPFIYYVDFCFTDEPVAKGVPCIRWAHWSGALSARSRSATLPSWTSLRGMNEHFTYRNSQYIECTKIM